MTRRAVVVGSNGPATASELKYARSDAERVGDALTDPKCGFEVTVIVEASDPQEVERKIAQVAEATATDDTFLVFFSGHGFVEGGALILMLDDTDINRPLTTALHAEAVIRSMRYCRAKHKVLVLDCCHAGAVFAESRFKDGQGVRVDSMVSPPQEESSSFVAIVASDRLERAREVPEMEGSFLTKALCEALTTRFADADFDRDGAVDLTDLKQWLTKAAQAHNTAGSNFPVPTPFVFGRERGRLYFSREPDEWTKWSIPSESCGEFMLLPALNEHDEAWLIGKTPVTNRQYRAFVEDGSGEPAGEHFVDEGNRKGWREGFLPWEDPAFCDPDQPVVCVDHFSANDFAAWANWKEPHLRIMLVPTKLWDVAAFGHPFPFHDRRDWPGVGIHHNSAAPARITDAADRTNRFGVVDLLGNVWEWTLTGLSDNPSLFTASYGWEERNQQLRGGSFLDDLSRIAPMIVAGVLKNGVSTRHSDLGFRVAACIPKRELPDHVARQLRGAIRILTHERDEIPRSA